MRRNPERTAWAVLLGSFCTFCALVLLIPLSVRWWMQNATDSQRITMVSSGTVLVTRPGRTTAEVNLTDIPVGSTISIAAADSLATLTFVDRSSQAVLASVKIYGNTWVNVVRAESPRYRSGAVSHFIQLQVAFGRVRVTNVAADKFHAAKIEVGSPPNAVTTLNDTGSEVALEVGGQSTLTVRAGKAVIAQTAAGQDGTPLVLLPSQRAEATDTGLRGPLPPERKLILNGTFEQQFENWTLEPTKQNDNVPGTVNVEDQSGRKVVHFYRQGISLEWGRVGLAQSINQNVSDFKTIVLQLDVLISNQDIYNCGQMGSECPIMVEILYQDTQGRQQTWLRGFYYNANDRPGTGLTKCPSCNAVASDHQLVPQNVWQSIQTENLVDIFRDAGGAPPAIIEKITVYASGHSFDSAIADVQLWGAE